jgi:hypothetical protein
MFPVPNPINTETPNSAKILDLSPEGLKSITIEFERGRKAPNPMAIIIRDKRRLSKLNAVLVQSQLKTVQKLLLMPMFICPQ